MYYVIIALCAAYNDQERECRQVHNNTHTNTQHINVRIRARVAVRGDFCAASVFCASLYLCDNIRDGWLAGWEEWLWMRVLLNDLNGVCCGDTLSEYRNLCVVHA